VAEWETDEASAKLIERIERLAFRAWPAVEVHECDGWRLRSTHGVTHRANSVWPNGDGHSLSLRAKLEVAEAFYAERARPSIFQLCPVSQPPLLDHELERRGYTRGRDTAVQIASLTDVLALTVGSEIAVTLENTCDDHWLTIYGEAENVESIDLLRRAEIMRRIEPAAAYAVAWSGGTPCAVGSAVCEDGWVGVFNMVTAAAYRRQGSARAVLAALATWAHALGATDIYLQVMRENTPAWDLYQHLGFTTLYGYHYRSHSLSHVHQYLTSSNKE
jgi:N-acetylglutamate synthase